MCSFSKLFLAENVNAACSMFLPCQSPASVGSRGYPKDEQRRREKTGQTSLDRATSARERERKRERQRDSDQMGGAAESGKSLFFTVAFIF